MGAKTWKLAGIENTDEIKKMQTELGLPRPIAVYFSARGIGVKDVPDFLSPKLGNLSDPYRFPGIKEASARLWEAISRREPILIHGDYDTDGITASALLAFVLRQNGATVYSFIPHRFDDGYGFTPESLDKALEAFGNCGVLVTVDCGITSCDAVKVAVERGIDVIITDHHEAGAELPEALAVINPKVYPELEDLQLLSGAGTAFKLSHAFIKYGRENNLGGFQTRLEEVLDYVALGTVADIVPLQGENRIMVKYGIEALRRQLRPGVRALIESSKLHSDLSPSDITFRMA
ncbi:MAG: DHH family phosphoesterase, partial [Lentisphaeria bacterium]|nr:DHH family phosphoesterase [Lentisphaeria bacterium]